jgi:hypothetical protein
LFRLSVSAWQEVEAVLQDVAVSFSPADVFILAFEVFVRLVDTLAHAEDVLLRL